VKSRAEAAVRTEGNWRRKRRELYLVSEQGTNDYKVRAVERAARILSALDDPHPERTLSEIARATDLPRATAYRILVTLDDCGLVERTSDGQRYRLGVSLAVLGLTALRRLSIRREARPHMEELMERFGETCSLGIFDQGRILDIEVLHSDHLLTVASEVGGRLPMHCTASGKAMLAFLPPAVVESVLEKPLKAYTENTITSAAQLREELEVVRQRGYAVDDEEHEIGVEAVSAPVLDRNGEAIAVLAIPGPKSRLNSERVEEIARALVRATSAISATRKHRGGR
jgi:DNA-binding IclR family transcriptional regulator